VCTGITKDLSVLMKLEEAASILGVSLEDITVDGLKQTYKKLALTWDAEKVGGDPLELFRSSYVDTFPLCNRIRRIRTPKPNTYRSLKRTRNSLRSWKERTLTK
jgi:hypothetical protein